MKTSQRVLTACAVLLVGATACGDLDVTNPNEPARNQVLRTAEDMEALVAGAFGGWWTANYSATQGPGMFLGVAAFQHSSNAANFGMLTYGALPRVPTQNAPTHPDWSEFSSGWFNVYRSLAAVAEGLHALEANPELQAQLGEPRVRRMRAVGRFMQGLGHASIAVLHERGFVVDETRPGITAGAPADLGEPVGYAELMEAAIAYWQQAIEIAEAGFTESIPAQWLGRPTTSTDLARLAYSLRAEYRANVARDAEQRRDVSDGGLVDWRAVLTDLERGVPGWELDELTLRRLQIHTPNWDTHAFYAGAASWQSANYMISGMADHSGIYQQWLAQPIAERHPDNAAHGPFLIQTPDLRFPQGASLGEQCENPGLHWQIPDPIWFGGCLPRAFWSQPARGTWRWSHYHRFEPVLWEDGDRPRPWIDADRLRLYAAEAHYRLGNRARAAELVNVTRVGVGGLAPTDAAGANASCVPRLPAPGAGYDTSPGDAICGGLFEMLKWEQREHSWGRGPFAAAWFFDSRGWGDLYRGTPIHLPIPATEAVVLGQPVRFIGGVGQPGGAPGSNYAWPLE